MGLSIRATGFEEEIFYSVYGGFNRFRIALAKAYGKEFGQLYEKWLGSQLCSNCGHVKKKLTLADRVYRCEHCGLEIDRDLNASINLKHTVRSTGI